MPGKLQPLAQNFPIVDASGNPNKYFILWAQQRQIDIAAGITAEQAQDLIDMWAAARDIIAGVGLDGGGALSSDVTIDLADTTVAPAVYGDATHVPQITVDQQGRITVATNVAISGGGGSGGSWGFPTPLSSVSANSVSSAHIGNVFTPSVNIKISAVQFYLPSKTNAAVYDCVIVALNGSNVITSVLATSATFTAANTTGEMVMVLFAAPVTLTAGVKHAILFGSSNQGNTFNFPVAVTAASISLLPFPGTGVLETNGRIAQQVPAIGQTVSVGTGGHYYCGALWST